MTEKFASLDDHFNQLSNAARRHLLSNDSVESLKAGKPEFARSTSSGSTTSSDSSSTPGRDAIISSIEEKREIELDAYQYHLLADDYVRIMVDLQSLVKRKQACIIENRKSVSGYSPFQRHFHSSLIIYINILE